MSKIFALLSGLSKAAEADAYRLAQERLARFLAVFEAPGDVARRLVLADWLSEQGDVQGEFIALQCDPSRKARMRASKLLARHRERFLGPLAKYVVAHRDETWEHGFLTAGRVRLDSPLVQEPALSTLKHVHVLDAHAPVFGSPWLRHVESFEVPAHLLEAARTTTARVVLVHRSRPGPHIR